MQDKKPQLEPAGHGMVDWFQIGTGVCQSCTLSPCLFNLIYQFNLNASCEMPARIKLKLKSRFLGEISKTSDIQMIPP